MRRKIQLSVHNIIQFSIDYGDISSSFMSMSRAIDGIRVHQRIQKSRPDYYDKERPIHYEIKRDHYSLFIEGRMDGLYCIDDKTFIVDEIKSTYKNLDELEFDTINTHKNQLLIYCYVIAQEFHLKEIEGQLTYSHLETKENKELRRKFSIEELEEEFWQILKPCLEWYDLYIQYLIVRDIEFKNLNFPFKNYRLGQREMAVKVYKSIEQNQISFFQAPTGIGKTLATLFPAMKSMYHLKKDKIFYLTAKTVGRAVAENTLKLLAENCKIKSVTLTAKEKICFQEDVLCEPEICPFAKGYYERLPKALVELFNFDIFDKDRIEKIAKKYNICPFELALDISLWVDVIVCDYNYAFDPRVYLKRFFEDVRQDYIFLIDESHNFPDRTRSMFSSEISKKEVLHVRRLIKNDLPSLGRMLNQINKQMLIWKKECQIQKDNFTIATELDNDLLQKIRSFSTSCEKWLAKNIKTAFRSELLDLYFNYNNFLKISELFSKNYKFFAEFANSDLRIKLFCLDPAPLIEKSLERANSSIFFSASLLPEMYFKRAILGHQDSLFYNFPSPFPSENLEIKFHNLSTRYKDRSKNLMHMSQKILKFLDENTGNTIVFFPSYAYMNLFVEYNFEQLETMTILVQSSNLNEEQRAEFLQQFNESSNLKAFCILGGIFGEGIDLVGEKLKYAIIVGTGLPQINPEQNMIKDYFDKENIGFDFAYRYPGFNKVLQAVGRIIRTETDTGKALLIDDRFTHKFYKDIIPNHWK